MRTGGPTTQDGLTHMVTHLNKSGDDVIAFEGKIADALDDADDITKICHECLFDVKIQRGDNIILREYKSYQIESLQLVNTTTKGVDFIKQFKQYLQNGNFEYIFNSNKITDINLIKKEFQTMFKNHADEIFEANKNLFIGKTWGNIEIERVEDFIELCSKSDFYKSDIFNFIKF
jgi:hypothetical protein